MVVSVATVVVLGLVGMAVVIRVGTGLALVVAVDNLPRYIL